MKTRYRIIRRGNRGHTFYCVDAQTRRRTSLNTSDLKAARRIVEAKNQAEEQPAINRQLAKAYPSGTDHGIATRTWQEAMEALTNMKQGANKERWQSAARDKAFAPLLPRAIIDTSSELLLKVLQTGTVSTHVYLRRLHMRSVPRSRYPRWRTTKGTRRPRR